MAFILVAQRFALLALGRAWTLLESSINSKPEKCLKMPQNPQRPVHALLDPVIEWVITNSMVVFYAYTGNLIFNGGASGFTS